MLIVQQLKIKPQTVPPMTRQMNRRQRFEKHGFLSREIS
jgi:hypothetical protein